MRKLLIAIVVIITVTLSIAAYLVTDGTNKHILKALDKLKNDGQISYESVEITGFPFANNVNIHNMEASIDSGKYIKEIFESLKERGSVLPDLAFPDKSWNSRIYVDGVVILNYNLIGTEYNLSIDGDTYLEDKIADKITKFVSKGSAKSALIVNLNYSPILVKKFPQLIEEPIDIFKSATLTSGAEELLNADTNKVIMKAKGSYISFEQKSKDVFNVIIKDKGSEFTKNITDILDSNPYIKLLNDEFGIYIEGFPATGEMVLNIDLSITIDVKKPEDGLDISVKNLDYSDNFVSNTNRGNIAFTKKDGDLTGKFIWNGEYQITQAWYDYVANRLAEGNLFTTYVGTQDIQPQISNFIKQLDSLGSASIGIIPRIHEMKKITYNYDAVISGNEKRKEFNVDMKNFNLSSELYGMNLSLKTDASNGGRSLTYDGKLVLKNYKKIISDLGNYINRVIPVIAKIKGFEIANNFTLEPDLISAIQKSIGEISDNTDNNPNASISIVKKADGQPSINGKDMSQIMTILMGNLSPHIQKYMPKRGHK